MECIDMKADPKTTSAAAKPALGTENNAASPLAVLANKLVAAAELFAQVAYLTDTVRTMGVLIVQEVGGADDTDSGNAVHYGITVEQLAAQIGAIADRGARLCGETGAVGDFEAWLLSAAARSALQDVAADRGRAVS